MDFNEEFADKQQVVEGWLENVIINDRRPEKITEAIQYAVLQGGKRIRPIIAMAVCEMVGGKQEDVMPFACAIELIHAYSLVHDDLPPVDNDDERRGKPSCHKKYGEAQAIFVGNTIHSLAFEIMSQSELTPILILECIKTVALAAGGEGMDGGQFLDISGSASLEEYTKMCTMKTGALIMASALVGALAGGVDMEQYTAIGKFAKNIGMAFQIKDDIMDSQEENESGDNMITNFIGVEEAETLLSGLIEEAKMDIHSFGEKSYFLQDLANFIESGA